jgi:hypothetical protein
VTAQILAMRPEWQPAVPNPWTDELHPWWCGETSATGCGSHMSRMDGVRATADPADFDGDGRTPIVSVAAFLGADGTPGVHLSVLHPTAFGGGEAWATFTAEQWRAVVALGEQALALIATDPQMAPLPARAAG